MNKKKVTLLAVVVICLATLATGTLAFFTADDTAHNVITSGYVDIEVEEWQQLPGSADLEPYPMDKPINVMPGHTVSKIPMVHNLGSEAAWVRAKVDIRVYDANNRQMDLSPEQLDALFHLTGGSGWTEKDDGWNYYNYKLEGSLSTTPLFESVTFDGPNMTNEYQNCTIHIDVKAQAVQFKNNPDALGWPDDTE